MKICCRCKKNKRLSSFYKCKRSKDCVDFMCKDCDSKRAKAVYKKDPKRKLKQKTDYLKRHPDRVAYNTIRDRAKTKRMLVCSMTDFIVWYNMQEKICVYCDMAEERAKNLFNRRLEIDRKNNDLGYTLENLALACHKCNLIKNDLFTFDEMREISQKFIKPKY